MISINTIKSLAQGVFQKLMPAFYQKSVSTSDATPTDLIRLTPDDNSVGVLWVMVAGAGIEEGVTGIKQVRYVKAGVVALGTVDSSLAVQADGSISTATFDIVADGGDIVVQVTGVAATDINWVGEYRFIQVVNETLL